MDDDGRQVMGKGQLAQMSYAPIVFAVVISIVYFFSELFESLNCIIRLIDQYMVQTDFITTKIYHSNGGFLFIR